MSRNGGSKTPCRARCCRRRWGSRCCPTCRTGRGMNTACAPASGGSSRRSPMRNIPVTLAINGNVCQLLSARRLRRAGGRLRIHGPWFPAGPDAQARQPGRRHQARGRGHRQIRRQAAALMGKPGPHRDRGNARSASPQRHRICRGLGDRRSAAGHRDPARHHHHHSLFGGDQRHRHPRPAAPAVGAVPEALHRPVRPALSGRRRQCAGDGDLDPPLHHRRAAPDQISGSVARLCHRP